MNKKLSAPTLIGFDDVGRSISKKDKSDTSKKDNPTSTAEVKKSAKKDAA